MQKLSATRQGVSEAARLIKAGGLVAFPTETFYGLAVDPANGQALARLFAVKQRPPEKAILLLVADRSHLLELVQVVPPVYEELMRRFWPGPLTLLFPARKNLQPLLTAGTLTVGIRMSSHPLAARLAEAAGGAITATSANLSGHPPAVSADAAAIQLDGDIDAVLDGGETPGHGSSTIVGMREGKLVVVREGVLPSVLLGLSRSGK